MILIGKTLKILINSYFYIFNWERKMFEDYIEIRIKNLISEYQFIVNCYIQWLKSIDPFVKKEFLVCVLVNREQIEAYDIIQKLIDKFIFKEEINKIIKEQGFLLKLKIYEDI